MKFMIKQDGDKWAVSEVSRVFDTELGVVLLLPLSGVKVTYVEINPDDYPGGGINTYIVAALIDGMKIINKTKWRNDFGQI